MKENKTEIIMFRVTEEEKKNLMKDAGKNLSKYIRKLIGLDK